MSTKRYLPASGTAGLARSFVSGNKRVPAPPPMMMERVLLVREFESIIRGIPPASGFDRLLILQAPKFFVTLVFHYVRHHRIHRQIRRHAHPRRWIATVGVSRLRFRRRRDIGER